VRKRRVNPCGAKPTQWRTNPIAPSPRIDQERVALANCRRLPQLCFENHSYQETFK